MPRNCRKAACSSWATRRTAIRPATLLDSYQDERAPIAKQIVTRANQSIGEFGPIFEALGMTGGTDIDKIKANMDARCGTSPEAEAQRRALEAAIAFKKYEFDAHGIEMNQRYHSGAIVTDGQPEPEFTKDAVLHHQPTTWPGARMPHVWLFDARGDKHSTLDLAGGGRFTVFTGLGGEAWVDAVQTVAAEMGIALVAHVIGPRQPYVDHTGAWARTREMGDTGCILTRPDQHVCWRHDGLPADPTAELRRVLGAVLAR
jgi:2,4-dichlorophenol 6-monooxygenase